MEELIVQFTAQPLRAQPHLLRHFKLLSMIKGICRRLKSVGLTTSLLLFVSCALPPRRMHSYALLPPAAFTSPKPILQRTPTTVWEQPLVPQQLMPIQWNQLEGWQDDTLNGVVAALRENCSRVGKIPNWQSICAAATRLKAPDRVAVRAFFERYFVPCQVADEHGVVHSIVTGYYQRHPIVAANRTAVSKADEPIGALGVPLTPQRSIAVDPTLIPLGMPVFLATTWPVTNQPLNRLVFAQDTGAAIKGWMHVDYFWGTGAQAGKLARRTKQWGRIWLLLPR